MIEHELLTGASSFFALVFSYFLEPISFLADSSKRIFWLYLLSACLITLIVGVIKKELAGSIKTLFSPLLWFNRSSAIDIQLLFINSIISKLLIIPVIWSQIEIALWLQSILSVSFGEGNYLEVSLGTMSLLFTLGFFLAEDFSRFFVHFIFHKHPLLWKIHAIHHSAESLTPITLYRVHPLESLVNHFRSIITAGIVTGIFIYLFSNKLTMVSLLGANIFTFTFNIAGANLRHSPIWISFGKFENLFISPAQHQIHHSNTPEHFDKNMGSALSIWDKIFGTFLASKGQEVKAYGIDKAEQTLASQLFMR